MTRDGTVGRFRRNRAKPGFSLGHRSRSNDEDSVRVPHQGQQSTRTAPTGRTHDCKRPLRCTPNDLLPGGGHPHMRRRGFIALVQRGNTMRSMTFCATILSFIIATAVASAQTPSPSAAAPVASPTDKQATSKACSDQADAKGLHGKARKKFRSECKKRGGRPQ